GISNINIDLIFATPGSDLSSIENDLKEFYTLDINHLSYYSLILEENTIFYSMYKKDKLVLIDNDLEAKMYEFIINDLEKNGFKQYEISNFAKDGYESVHNKIYWLNKEYIGVGLGASGYLDGVRYTNNTVLNEYYKKYRKSIEIIDFNTKFSEEMILGLRLSRGINIEYVNKTYKKDLLKDFKDIEKYIKSGDLVIEDGYLHLTKKGMLIANDIFVLFI
nr:coproporphyrinogen III oxidase [bacterium]